MREPGEREGRGQEEGQEVSRIDTKEAGEPEFAYGLIDPSRIAHMRVRQDESGEKKKSGDGGNSRFRKFRAKAEPPKNRGAKWKNKTCAARKKRRPVNAGS